jgi:hypothetical protein
MHDMHGGDETAGRMDNPASSLPCILVVVLAFSKVLEEQWWVVC